MASDSVQIFAMCSLGPVKGVRGSRQPVSVQNEADNSEVSRILQQSLQPWKICYANKLPDMLD